VLLQISVPLNPLSHSGHKLHIVAPLFLAPIVDVSLHLVLLSTLQPGVKGVRVGHCGRECKERTTDQSDDVLPSLSTRFGANVVNFVEDHISQTFSPGIPLGAEEENLQALGHSDKDLTVEGVLLEVPGVDALHHSARWKVHLSFAEPCAHCG